MGESMEQSWRGLVGPDPFTVLCRRSLHAFAEALADTPADELSRHAFRGEGRNRRRATSREVLIDGMTAAADLLAMDANGRRPSDGD